VQQSAVKAFSNIRHWQSLAISEILGFSHMMLIA
jgi:hypothetical protein